MHLGIEVDAHSEQIGTATLEIEMYEHGGVLRAEEQPVYFVRVNALDVGEVYANNPQLTGLFRFDREEQEWGMYVIGIGRRRTTND